MAPEVVDESAPRHGLSEHKKRRSASSPTSRSAECGRHRPQACTSSRSSYPAGHVVPAYHDVRREFLAATSRPALRTCIRSSCSRGRTWSTVDGAVCRDRASGGASIDLRISRSTRPPLPPALTCGDYGLRRRPDRGGAEDREGPLDPAARMPAGHLWKGTPIKLETEFVIERKLTCAAPPALRSRASQSAVPYCATSTTSRPSTKCGQSTLPEAPPATTSSTPARPASCARRAASRSTLSACAAVAAPGNR